MTLTSQLNVEGKVETNHVLKIRQNEKTIENSSS